MKIEIGEQKPEQYKEHWPGQYHFFSHFEYVSGVPHELFLITTLKENGKPNACFHSWSAFSGDHGGFFAVMPGLMMHTHTYANILRDKEFCVNFLSAEHYDKCSLTIQQNDMDTDELAVGQFTAEPSATIRPPRIKEAFLSFECVLESVTDLSGKGVSAMIVGRVHHAAVEEHHHLVDSISGANGFMYNIHSPRDPKTGNGNVSAVATLQIVRRFDE